jgi:hypothetical protein
MEEVLLGRDRDRDRDRNKIPWAPPLRFHINLSLTWKLPSPMQAITRLSLAAWAYPRVAPTDQPIDPYCIWNSYLNAIEIKHRQLADG